MKRVVRADIKKKIFVCICFDSLGKDYKSFFLCGGGGVVNKENVM